MDKVKDPEQLANDIFEFLGLRLNRQNRIPTAWGDKSPHGFGLCIERIYHENLLRSQEANQPGDPANIAGCPEQK